MANWQTDTITSSFDTMGGANKIVSDRGAQRSASSVGTHKTGGFLGIGAKTVSNLPASSIVGMNVNEVENMREAIEDYCAAIENYLKGLNPTADATIAFKSEEVNAALRDYMEKVKEYCLNLVSQLRAFSDKLADVRNQWQTASQNIAETIGSTSGSAFASGTTYTRTIQ
ncbi:MAG: hypothetical protein E7164_03600 [Firmicutes bacterium]|nr:hypothetical protein [Bacillota bacterium]